MATKRELILKVFHNEEAERIPVGFWHHFLEGDEFNRALAQPELLEKNLAGHRKFKEEFDPDFVKVMTDGLFFLPYDYAGIRTVEDLKKIQPLSPAHPWFAKNVELAKGVREIYGDDILIFYNAFSPLTQLRNGIREAQAGRGVSQDRVLDFLARDARAVAAALDVIAGDIGVLIEKVVRPGLADGLYFSVSNPNREIPADLYAAFISPSEKKVLALAKKASPDNILHICGFAGNKNILSVYRDYDASVINWAVHVEGVGLKEGKEFFGGKPVIGGFENTKDSVLYRGTREEVERYVEQLLAEAGRRGLVVGADCTVPADIPTERLEWVREKAAAL